MRLAGNPWGVGLIVFTSRMMKPRLRDLKWLCLEVAEPCSHPLLRQRIWSFLLCTSAVFYTVQPFLDNLQSTTTPGATAWVELEPSGPHTHWPQRRRFQLLFSSLLSLPCLPTNSCHSNSLPVPLLGPRKEADPLLGLCLK